MPSTFWAGNFTKYEVSLHLLIAATKIVAPIAFSEDDQMMMMTIIIVNIAIVMTKTDSCCNDDKTSTMLLHIQSIASHLIQFHGTFYITIILFIKHKFHKMLKAVHKRKIYKRETE